MSSQPAARPAAMPAPAKIDPEASVDAAIAECGGDLRATIWELLTERAHMEAEAARLAGAVSQGYVRDALRQVRNGGPA